MLQITEQNTSLKLGF